MNVLYPVNIEHDIKNECYVVKFFDFKDVIIQGKSIEDALTKASEFLTNTLEVRMKKNVTIPVPSVRHDVAHSIAPSVKVQTALLVRWIKDKKTIADIARKLETSWPAAARLTDPQHWPTLRQLDRTATILGHRLIISMEKREKE